MIGLSLYHWFLCEGNIAVLAKYTQVKKVDFRGCRQITGECRVQSKEISWSFLLCTSPHFLTECSLPCVPGVFTGPIIRMISDMRAKHGKGSVNLYDCGKFTLAEDLSDISDMTRIDLSGINSLEGEPLEKFPGGFFCAPVRTFA